MTKKKAKPRGGPRTVNRKGRPASVRVEDFAPIAVPMATGPYEEATGLDNIVDGQPVPPATAVPFTPQPAPWSCQCGVDRNSALVEECPVCHAKRPYEYTAPEPVLAVPSDYPQPGESMEDYAIRMKDDQFRKEPRHATSGPPTDAEMDAELAEIESASIGPWSPAARENWKARRLAAFYEKKPVDPGRARELPDPQGLCAKGYASPISFAGPVGSVDVDPLLLQMALDVANKAAQTGVVQSVTVGLKGPSQARVIVRFDLDVASAPWPRAVKDED
jgi:hypothetical protein